MKIKNTCIADTVYALALYLLYMPMSEIRKTRFFLGSVIPKTYSDKLDNVVRLDTAGQLNGERKLPVLSILRVRLRFLFYSCFFLSGTCIFGQDHLAIFCMMIGLHRYTLLEDAPAVFSRLAGHRILDELMRPMCFRERVMHALRFGMLPYRFFGNSDKCLNRILTEPDDVRSPLIKGRCYELVNLKALWTAADEEKKNFLRGVFGLKDEVCAKFHGCETLFVTQPYREDAHLTDDDWAEVVKKILSCCTGKILIKVHPRDKFDYHRHFPELEIFDLPIPMQLLVFAGIQVKKVITINSSAIYSFPVDVEKIELGPDIHPKIYNYNIAAN